MININGEEFNGNFDDIPEEGLGGIPKAFFGGFFYSRPQMPDIDENLMETAFNCIDYLSDIITPQNQADYKITYEFVQLLQDEGIGILIDDSMQSPLGATLQQPGNTPCLVYNPEQLKELPEDDVSAVIFHEIYHMYLNQTGRDKAVKFDAIVEQAMRIALTTITLDSVKNTFPTIAPVVGAFRDINIAVSSYLFRPIAASIASCKIEKRCDEFANLVNPQNPMGDIMKRKMIRDKERAENKKNIESTDSDDEPKLGLSKRALHAFLETITKSHPFDQERVELSRVTQAEGYRLQKKHNISPLVLD